jgi:hypothetical protein
VEKQAWRKRSWVFFERLKLEACTLALNNTGSEPCDPANYYTFRANPITKQMEMCRS